MSVTPPEANKYYGCDPFIPGAFAENTPQIGSRRPLRHFVTTLGGHLRGSDGALIASKGAVIVELGFVASLHPIDRDQLHIRSMLGRIAGPLRLARMALEGHSVERMGDNNLAFLRAPFQEQGRLPTTVIAHTRPDVAEVAVRDFGFAYAGTPACVPKPRAEAIQALGHEPVTIYMPIEQFLAIEAC